MCNWITISVDKEGNNIEEEIVSYLTKAFKRFQKKKEE